MHASGPGLWRVYPPHLARKHACRSPAPQPRCTRCAHLAGTQAPAGSSAGRGAACKPAAGFPAPAAPPPPSSPAPLPTLPPAAAAASSAAAAAVAASASASPAAAAATSSSAAGVLWSCRAEAKMWSSAENRRCRMHRGMSCKGERREVGASEEVAGRGAAARAHLIGRGALLLGQASAGRARCSLSPGLGQSSAVHFQHAAHSAQRTTQKSPPCLVQV